MYLMYKDWNILDSNTILRVCMLAVNRYNWNLTRMLTTLAVFRYCSFSSTCSQMDYRSLLGMEEELSDTDSIVPTTEYSRHIKVTSQGSSYDISQYR